MDHFKSANLESSSWELRDRGPSVAASFEDLPASVNPPPSSRTSRLCEARLLVEQRLLQDVEQLLTIQRKIHSAKDGSGESTHPAIIAEKE